MADALRLTLEQDGDRLTLVSIRRLQKRVAVSSARPTPTRVGRFVELRGEKDEVLQRLSVTQRFADTIEYRTGDPNRPLSHRPRPERRQIVILIPWAVGGRTVAIVDTRQPRTDQAAARTAVSRDLLVAPIPEEIRR